MDIIHLLPDAVANQIAAGEVIQRPASVIKELIENAIDAGASNINVVLEDAGRTLIQVVDDGKGMSDTDARLAFERHATSKIKKADDLFALKTMGFRGEALPSIAAVSKVNMITKTATEEMVKNMDDFGASTQTATSYLALNMARARSQGLDAQKASETFAKIEELKSTPAKFSEFVQKNIGIDGSHAKHTNLRNNHKKCARKTKKVKAPTFTFL